MRLVLVSTALLVTLCIPCAAYSFVPPVALVRSQAIPSERTGLARTTLGDAFSYEHQPPAITSFRSFRNKGFPSQQTHVSLYADDKQLFIEFRCFDDAVSVAAREHDGPVWRDDSVEILLDPDNDGKDCFHLIANAAGTMYEERGRPGNPKSWDGPWHAHRWNETDNPDVREWSLLVRIPFKSLGVKTPRLGEVWGANFGRNDRPQGKISSWSPVIGEFAEPQWFGLIVFGGTQAPIIGASVPEIGAPGKHAISTKISNAGGGAMPLHVGMLVDGKPYPAKIPVYEAPKGDSEWEFSIEYPLEGSHKLSLQFTDSDGKVIMRTAPVAVHVPPHSRRVDRFRQFVRQAGPSRDTGDLRRKLLGLTAFQQTARVSAERWAELGKRLDDVEPEVSRLRFASADTEKRGYVIGTETSLTKILRDRWFDGEVGQPVRISAARNEFESAQVVVLAYAQTIEGAEVTASMLTGPNGAQLSAELNLVEYVQTRKPKYDVDYVGWWPDPLMPMKPFDVPKGSLQPIWVTVHPSEQTPAGIYEGTITVRPKNAPESSIPIEVRVWDFTLPVTPHLKTAFALFEHEIGAWYGGTTEEIKRNYYAFMLDHRLSVMNLYSKQPIPRREDMRFCFDRGQNFMTLAYTHNKDQEGRDELARMIREHRAFTEPKGWWDKACIYGFDEIKPDKYHELRDMYGWIGREFPGLPRMCTVAPTEELMDSIDIWVPLTSNWIEKDAREFESSGNEVWWYVCCVPYHPYPNFFIDYPAVDQRIVFWMNWKYGIPGFLYYAVNLWEVNRKSKDRWPEVAWDTFTFQEYNGDGHLVYPGPDGKPISSIRLECIRDGIEDYDYFAILMSLRFS